MAILATKHQCRCIVAVTQQVLGEVEPCPLKPARTGHRVRILQHGVGRLGRLHRAEAPQQ
jgi:hypothetical protein